MGNISSINIKKTNAIQTKHNARDEDFKPSYLLESGGKAFECNRSSLEAELLRDRMIKEAQERYKQRTGQKFQAKSFLASAVINLKADSTMQDVERVAEHLQKKHKFQCYQIAIHRDEGHIDENGKECINYHAHLEFVTLDKETGRNMWQTKHIGIGKLRELQSEVAQILQMERGVDKRLSGAKRIEPRKYAIMKEREKAERKVELEIINDLTAKNATLTRDCDRLKQENEQLLTPKEVKEILESFRKQCIGKGLPKEFFRALSAEKQNSKQSTKQELELFCNDLLNAFENKENELQKERELRKKAELRATELESKIAQNRDFADTKATAPVQPKSAEVAHSEVITELNFKDNADRDFKEILKELNISVNYNFKDENAVYTNSNLYLANAKEIRDELENKGYYVQIAENYNIVQENRFAVAFAKSKVAFEKIYEFVSKSWKSFYKTNDLKLEKQKTLNNKPKINEKAKSKQNDSYGMSM